jgi:hypothetical protein
MNTNTTVWRSFVQVSMLARFACSLDSRCDGLGHTRALFPTTADIGYGDSSRRFQSLQCKLHCAYNKYNEIHKSKDHAHVTIHVLPQ